MILLDTTVLVYAVGGAHPLREPCRRLLRAQRDRDVYAATTIEVIQEFVHIRSHRRSRLDAVSIARRYAQGLDLVDTSHQDLELGLQLFKRTDRLGSFDSVLAAVALNRRMDALVSADRGFSHVPALTWIDPSSSALDQFLLGS